MHPGHDDTYVNYKNPDRAPLFFIAESEDHLMLPRIQRSNAKHYEAEGTITEVKEFEGRAHFMPAEEGWEEIADLPDLGRRTCESRGCRARGAEQHVRVRHRP
jgi:hypothetical protein